MPAWIAPSWESLPRLLLQAGMLFVAATFVFDAIHFTLHQCLNARHAWLRRLARPHLAHHVFFDRRLQYHDEALVPNLFQHMIPEYATQMAVCAWPSPCLTRWRSSWSWRDSALSSGTR